MAASEFVHGSVKRGAVDCRHGVSVNKRIIVVACTMACGSRAIPPVEPEPVDPPIVEPATVEPTTVDETPGRSMEHEISRNPPAQPMPVQELPPAVPIDPLADVQFTGDPWRGRHESPQNPRVDGKTVYRASDQTCYVHGEFPANAPPRFPGQSPPSEAVDCPPQMNDAVYDLCRGGVVYKHNDACGCFVMGNPPPPARALSRCPAHSSNAETD